MFASLNDSLDVNASALGQDQSDTVLKILFVLAIWSEILLVLEELLAINSAPETRAFLNRYQQQLSPDARSSPRLWSLMIKHGWMDADRDGTLLNGPLRILLGNDVCERANIFELVRLLLECGVKPDMRHLSTALDRRHIDLVQLLFEKIDRELLKDCRLLDNAVRSDRIDMVQWLLDVTKMDVYTYPTTGPEPIDMYMGEDYEPKGTPLNSAVYWNRRSIAKLSLSRGAITNIKNGDGETAWEDAKDRNDWYMMALMMFY